MLSEILLEKLAGKKDFLFKNTAVIISGVFLSITVIVVILNVILRYVFNTGFYWVEEVATSCFIWSVFIGAAAAYKKKMHIGIEIFPKMFSHRIQQLIIVVVDFLMVIINGYIFYLSIIFIRASYIKPTAVLGVSSSWVSSSILVGFGLITVYALIFFIRSIRSLILKDPEKGVL